MTATMMMTTAKPTQMIPTSKPFNSSGQVTCVRYSSKLCGPYLFTDSVAQLGSMTPNDEEVSLSLSIFFSQATGSISSSCVQTMLPLFCETTFPECYNNKAYYLCREDCESALPATMACLKNMSNVHLPNCSRFPSRKNNGTCNDLVRDTGK